MPKSGASKHVRVAGPTHRRAARSGLRMNTEITDKRYGPREIKAAKEAQSSQGTTAWEYPTYY